MMLAQDGQPIAHIRSDRNLFLLGVAVPGKIMEANQLAMITRVLAVEDPTHLVSRSKKVRVWHRTIWSREQCNRIIRASKLVTGTGYFGSTYNPAEIYSGSKASD